MRKSIVRETTISYAKAKPHGQWPTSDSFLVASLNTCKNERLLRHKTVNDKYLYLCSWLSLYKEFCNDGGCITQNKIIINLISETVDDHTATF